jgi:hypothetical protein
MHAAMSLLNPLCRPSNLTFRMEAVSTAGQSIASDGTQVFSTRQAVGIWTKGGGEGRTYVA